MIELELWDGESGATHDHPLIAKDPKPQQTKQTKTAMQSWNIELNPLCHILANVGDHPPGTVSFEGKNDSTSKLHHEHGNKNMLNEQKGGDSGWKLWFAVSQCFGPDHHK